MTKKQQPVNKELQQRLKNEPHSTPYARGERVRLLRSMTNLSRDDLAEKYPFLNSNTLKSWENGREGGLSAQGAQRLIDMAKAEGIDCQFDWLMYQIGDGPRVLNLSIAETHKSDLAKSRTANPKQQIIDELRLFKFHNPLAIDLIIKDDSMTPHFLPGDIIAGIPYYDADLERVIGKNCIVQLENGVKLFRLLKNGQKINRFNLYCLNFNSTTEDIALTDQNIICAAPIMWHRRPL